MQNMEKDLNRFLSFLIAGFLLTITCLAQTNDLPRVEIVNGESLPINIVSTLIYETYDSGGSIHNIEFSLTNKSDLYIGRVSFIQYALDKKNVERTTTVWGNQDGFQPFETKHLSVSFETISSKATKLIWIAHRICTDKGTWNIDLSDLRKVIFPYHDGKNIILPAAEFHNELKCLPE